MLNAVVGGENQERKEQWKPPRHHYTQPTERNPEGPPSSSPLPSFDDGGARVEER
jgi:hypothetical protein